MSLLAALWRGFVRLFGLDACPLPGTAPRSPRLRGLRDRLGRG